MKCEIQLDVFLIKGDYTLSTFFSSANGPFTVTLKNVVAKGNASVGVERDGVIRTQDISMDMTFDDLAMDFQNLGERKKKTTKKYHREQKEGKVISTQFEQVSWVAFFSQWSMERRI